MTRIYLILFCVIGLAGAYPCSAQTDSLKHLHLLPPCCSDRGTPLPQDSSLTIVEGAARMWESAFSYHYTESSTAFPDSYPFKIPVKKIQQYIGIDSNYKGIKVYFGLENKVDTLPCIPRALCLVLVPYDTIGDLPFPYDTVGKLRSPCNIGPSIKVNYSGITEQICLDTAQSYIDNWRLHYNLDSSYMLRVYGYSLSKSTLKRQIAVASQSPQDTNLYIFPGLHTVMPCDTGYCLIDSGGGCAPGNSYGFAVVNLILATKSGGGYLRSSDFLRPCPRFCGRSLFSLYCD